MFKIVYLYQAAALGRHLYHMALEVQHFGAVRAAGDDLAVEFVLDAGLGLQGPKGRDVLQESVLCFQLAVAALDRGVARQDMGDAAIWVLQAEFQTQRFAVEDARLPGRLDPLQIFGVDTFQPAVVLKPGRLQVKNALQSAVDVGEHALGIGSENADRKNR